MSCVRFKVVGFQLVTLQQSLIGVTWHAFWPRGVFRGLAPLWMRPFCERDVGVLSTDCTAATGIDDGDQATFITCSPAQR